jgi:membrane protein
VGGRVRTGRSGTLTTQGFAALARRLETTFLGRCVSSFIALQGIDRALVLASQAFTALIPLLLLVAALAPADRRDVVSDAVIGRFRLTGDAAAAVEQLFAGSGSSSIGLLSGFLLLFSGVSLTRRMQRMYQQAWGLDAPPGVGHAVHAALGLTALLVGLSLLYLARGLVGSLPWSDVLLLVVSAGAAFVLFATVPWLLLDRRLPWRRLVPTGLVTAACTSAYGVASTIYMPRLMETYSRRYGLFGVTLALVGWLLAIAVILVASTVVAAEFDRAQEPWARRLRRRLGVASSAARSAPHEGVRPPPAPRPGAPGGPQSAPSPGPVDPRGPGGPARRGGPASDRAP